MEITYSPSALPGSCYFCGNGSREFYVDTKLSVEFHGAMYICNFCCEEIARLVKFIPHAEYKSLLADNEELSELTYQYKVRIDALEGALRDLANAGYRVADGSVIVSGGAVLETPSETRETVSDGEGELGAGTGTPTESGNDSDVGELRSDEPKHEPIFGFLRSDSSEGNE